MEKYLPLSVPVLKGNELKYVTNAIETEWISTGGQYINKFEEKITDYVNSKGAVACQSGTAGLHIALKICEIKEHDEVIVPTLTFIAAVNPIKYSGAEPVFMDCDDSLCIDGGKVAEFCEYECEFINGKLINKQTGKHIKAIIVVHIFGNMTDMEKIMCTAKKYNLKVIEDATEAVGTYYTKGPYKNRYAGTIGDVGVFSFNANKIMTTGGGGMIVSNNGKLLEYAKHLTTQAKIDPVYYIHDEIGYNYRMTNLQAAVGLAQLEKINEFIQRKKSNFKLYGDELQGVKGLSMLEFREGINPNYWFYGLFCGNDYYLDRDEVISYLEDNKIQSRPIWGLISNQKPYVNCQTYKIEKASYYIKHVVNIPCSSNLTQDDVLRVVRCLANVER